MTKIIPFTSEHIDAAAQLLADRHQQDIKHNDLLPSRFTSKDCAAQAIKVIFEKEVTSGFAILDGEQMLAYMLGTLIPEDYLGDKSQGWVYLPSYAAQDTALFIDLYSVIAESWVRQNCFDHFLHCSAHDNTLQDLWFSLSFGREQAHGVLRFDVANVKETDATGITIRLATTDDESYFRQMATWISRYQTYTPTFAPVTQAYLAKQVESFAALIEDVESGEARVFLAFKGDNLVAYQIYYPVEADATNMMHPQEATELVVSATHPDMRGLGIGRTLTQHAFQVMQTRDYSICVADWRTTNRTASRFWHGMGFKPSHYRLARRLDDRIAKIYQELWT